MGFLMVRLPPKEKMKEQGLDVTRAESGIETQYDPIPSSDIPQVLQGGAAPSPSASAPPPTPASPQAEGFWDKQTMEAIIGTIGGLLEAYSKRAVAVIERRKAYLAEATAPVMNKYIKTGWGVEINCALAWSLVGLEIYRELKAEKDARP